MLQASKQGCQKRNRSEYSRTSFPTHPFSLHCGYSFWEISFTVVPQQFVIVPLIARYYGCFTQSAFEPVKPGITISI